MQTHALIRNHPPIQIHSPLQNHSLVHSSKAVHSLKSIHFPLSFTRPSFKSTHPVKTFIASFKFIHLKPYMHYSRHAGQYFNSCTLSMLLTRSNPFILSNSFTQIIHSFKFIPWQYNRRAVPRHLAQSGLMSSVVSPPDGLHPVRASRCFVRPKSRTVFLVPH